MIVQARRSVLVLMTLFTTTLSQTVRCKAGSFSLGETASVTCYFHEDLGKSLHHVYVSFSPFDSRNEVTDNKVLVCYRGPDNSRSCESASGYNWDNVISSNLTIEIPDVETRFAGHYSCHLVPLDDLQIKPCDLRVEDGNGPSLVLTAIILGAVGGILIITLIVLVAVYCPRNRLNKKGRSGQPSSETGIEISPLQQVEETNDSGTEMPTRRQLKETFDPGKEMSTLQQHAETSDPVKEPLLNKTMEQTLEAQMSVFRKRMEKKLEAQMSVFGKMVEEKLEAQMSVFGKMVEEKLELKKKQGETYADTLHGCGTLSERTPIQVNSEDDECATSTTLFPVSLSSTKELQEMLDSSTSRKEMLKRAFLEEKQTLFPFSLSSTKELQEMLDSSRSRKEMRKRAFLDEKQFEVTP